MAGSYPLDDADIKSLVEHRSLDESCPGQIEEYGDVDLQQTLDLEDLQRREEQVNVSTCDLGRGQCPDDCRPRFNGLGAENGILSEEDRPGQPDWREVPVQLEAAFRDEENEQDQYHEVFEVNEALSAVADVEEPDSSEDFCPAEQPLQFKAFSQMNELIEAVKDGHIKTGAILKDPRSILGFDFHHFFMFLTIDEKKIKFINLEKNFFWACCKVRNISLSASHQNPYIKFNAAVILVNNDPLNKEEIKKMHDRFEEYFKIYKPFIPYCLKSNKGFNCESFVNYLRSGEKRPSLEVKEFEERYGKRGISVIYVIDKFLIAYNIIFENFENYLHMF